MLKNISATAMWRGMANQPAPAPSVEDLPPYLTVDQVAAVLQLNRKTIYEAIQREELPAVWIGHNLRIRRETLLNLPNKRK